MPFTLDRYEAAKDLEISTRTLDRYVKAGKIRSKRVGKKVFLLEADIEKMRHELSRDADFEEGAAYTRGVDNSGTDEIVFFDE